MKIVTAHDLLTGEVLYRAIDGAWSRRLGEAETFEDASADAALSLAKVQGTRVVNAYLVHVDVSGLPAKREFLRESIRANGPSVRLDLGRQAEPA